MGGDRRGAVGADVEDALLAFLGQEDREFFPKGPGSVGGPDQKVAGPFVRGVIPLQEVADIDPFSPGAGGETSPSVHRIDPLLVFANMIIVLRKEG
jgi:hypothetical protein